MHRFGLKDTVTGGKGAVFGERGAIKEEKSSITGGNGVVMCDKKRRLKRDNVVVDHKCGIIGRQGILSGQQPQFRHVLKWLYY